MSGISYGQHTPSYATAPQVEMIFKSGSLPKHVAHTIKEYGDINIPEDGAIHTTITREF